MKKLMLTSCAIAIVLSALFSMRLLAWVCPSEQYTCNQRCTSAASLSCTSNCRVALGVDFDCYSRCYEREASRCSGLCAEIWECYQPT